MLNESDLALIKDNSILRNRSRDRLSYFKPKQLQQNSDTHKMLKHRINDRSLYHTMERLSLSIDNGNDNNNNHLLNGVITCDDNNSLEEQSRLLATQQQRTKTARRERPAAATAPNYRATAAINENNSNTFEQQHCCSLVKSFSKQQTGLKQLLGFVLLFSLLQYFGSSFQVNADDNGSNATTIPFTPFLSTTAAPSDPLQESIKNKTQSFANNEDSIFLRFAKRFTTDNVLWNGLIRDCYRKPTFSCFQKNVYVYLNDVLEYQDVNVTQRLKFFQNQNKFDYREEQQEEEEEQQQQYGDKQQLMDNQIVEDQSKPTQSTLAKDDSREQQDNEIPLDGRRSFAGECFETHK